MKFCRFVPSDPSVSAAAPLYATLEEDELREIPGPPWTQQQRLPSSRSWKRAAVRLVAPVAPGKVVCIGRNYAAHAAELVFFESGVERSGCGHGRIGGNKAAEFHSGLARVAV